MTTYAVWPSGAITTGPKVPVPTTGDAAVFEPVSIWVSPVAELTSAWYDSAAAVATGPAEIPAIAVRAPMANRRPMRPGRVAG